MVRPIRVTALAVIVAVALVARANGQNLAFSLFERYLEALRVQTAIPGMSAAVLQDGQVVWRRGFGLADVESSVVARSDTPYFVADLTQTFTTLLLARCAERGFLQPDDPLRRWVPLAPDPPASLRQVLTHTSGISGVFRYDPARFALLTSVVEACARQPYRQALAEAILDPVAMLDAVPGRDFRSAVQDGGGPLFEASSADRYAAVLQRLATPYKVDKRGRATRAELLPQTIDAASGLIASVEDLAKFDAALSILVRPDTLSQAWTNATVNGVAQPTTMGWFAQTYQGHRLIWHYGLFPDAYSALVLKIPTKHLTLILLANSDGLSAPFALQNGDVTTSLFAHTFLRLFL